ncbi:Protein of unknown function [Pyronema omphalodes CBS 100304]|uniref:Uncharacterized protein n=1 Tax=Pyronema omphalodes (strain CBS 100304) TaxID=1076935 RepID=U4LU44_PYROM|nr:Protein of unknown function [Pyronema omphalodes CBS 100304]
MSTTITSDEVDRRIEMAAKRVVGAMHEHGLRPPA